MKTLAVVYCALMIYTVSPCAAQKLTGFSAGARGGLFGSSTGGRDDVFSKGWYGDFPKMYNLTPNFEDIESQSTLVVSGGLFVQYHITKTFAVETELLYKPEAMVFEREMTLDEPGWYTWPGRIRLEGRSTYLQVPLLCKAVFDVRGDLLPFVYAGPGIAILIDHSISGRVISLNTDDTGEPFRTAVEMQSAVLGACIGGGVYVRSSDKVTLGLDVRYNWNMQSAVRSITIENSRSRDIDMRFNSWGVSGLMQVAL